ncbi:hypothetical protein B0H16DRAFT_1431431 [Mycena metata]|uniref:Retrovirus-related Pol polyprotein from transposon TNT 1-94-like beta-barrel domain-containing protein n=1 Tax=Mycena metata TaxID=1033252 RepID=A0AAD7HKK8_9AGAR|nr:hypothetical protein B0H16DRAFT_1431431 [Mycena metata]
MSNLTANLLSGAEDWPMFRVNTQSELHREGVYTLLEPVIEAATAADASTAAIVVTASLITLAVTAPTPAAAAGTTTTAPAPAAATGITTLVAGLPAPSVAFKDTPRERNSRALGIIQKFLSAELCLEYVDETSAATLWANLRARFEEENRADTAMGILNTLFHTKLVVESEAELIDRTKIETHIGVVKGYFGRLARLKYPFPAELQPLILLSTLPDDPYWARISGNIISSLGTGMSLDKVCARLLTLGKHPTPGDSDDSALAAKPQGSNKAKSASSSGDKHCVFHGTNNSHTSEQCHHLRKRKAVEEAKKGNLKSGKKTRKRSSKANASAASDLDSDDEDSSHIASVSPKSYAAMSAYISSDSSTSKLIIVLDSGATRVMTPNLDWFETGTYQILNPPRKVRLRNDTYCDAVGMGTLRFSCKTKRGMTNLSLNRALHVPSFGLTLVSV